MVILLGARLPLLVLPMHMPQPQSPCPSQPTPPGCRLAGPSGTCIGSQRPWKPMSPLCLPYLPPSSLSHPELCSPHVVGPPPTSSLALNPDTHQVLGGGSCVRAISALAHPRCLGGQRQLQGRETTRQAVTPNTGHPGGQALPSPGCRPFTPRRGQHPSGADPLCGLTCPPALVSEQHGALAQGSVLATCGAAAP